ncbi:uncharacterized protein [Ptychodera flava]|uniref:uncharacterized protein n=1 Tax=Ptychodera flava TaxID=63121 RepID=UPI00396A0983
MSMRTKINGFTAWVNLRLMPYNLLMSNVLMDLLKGTNMKMLIESLTGIENKRIQSFDDLTQQQKVTRMEWIVKELRESEILPEDVYVDCRLFAMRHAEHVFDLLWKLIEHDIWFTWERMEFMLQTEDSIIAEVPFKWSPEPPPAKKKKKIKKSTSLLSGFGSASVITESLPTTPEPMPEYDKFPGYEIVNKYKPQRKNWQPPDADDCIIEMINAQLQTVREGRRLVVTNMDDLVDSRVLCALVNSFAPGTFTTEVMLNDRWTINLALKVFEKIIRLKTPVDSEDLVEADPMAMSSYMCVYFMCGYKLKQAKAVINRLSELTQLIREANHELENFPAIINTMAELKRKKELKSNLESYESEYKRLTNIYDLDECNKWWRHVDEIQAETRAVVAEKMKQRFDTMTVPRNITINDLCLSMVINLSLTGGSGFYLAKFKETFTPDRRIVLKHLESGEYIDDFTQAKGQKKISIRKILGLPRSEVIDINPSDYPQYEMYFESQSRNKTLKAGSIFMYQVFPGNTLQWELLYFKAAKMGELDTVQKLVVFFRKKRPSFINAKEKRTGNTALHWAARNGHYRLVLYLLESGAYIDSKNTNGGTPFFCAVEGLSKGISQLLVEWGANVHMKNNQSRTAFDLVRNDELKTFLTEYYEHLTASIPKLMDGDTYLLKQLVDDHVLGIQTFASLRSRCINGSTLIHTAAYFGCISVIKELLKERVDVNLVDYKGATALHRAKDAATIQVLLDNGGYINAEDSEGNTALHVKCYGESGKPTQTECIQLLLESNISLTHRNCKELLAIHCCAMQGRIDALALLLNHDVNSEIPDALDKEDVRSPPSLPHLAIANDFLDCATWLVEQGYGFKLNEQDVLMHRVLTEQIKVKKRVDVLKFLLDNGADMNQRYAGGNTPLHYSAGMTGPTDILEILLAYGADVDALNDDQCTPLFFAMQANNMYSASVLIDNGSNVRHKNIQGLTAFDCILDFDEWIECPYFSDEMKARLKAYSLKHARDLVRAITKKVKNTQQTRFNINFQQSTHSMPSTMLGSPQPQTLYLMQSRSSLHSPSRMLAPVSPSLSHIPGRGSSGLFLPPLRSSGFLT